MQRVMKRAAAAALLLWCGGAAMSPARAQTVVLTARSVGELADDLSDLVMKVAPPGDERVAMVNGVIEQLKKGELVKGLDNGRLVGVAASLPGNLGEPPSLLAAIPVTDFGQFMDSLQGFGLAVEDAGMPGFSRKVSAGDGNQKQTFFALEANKYAIFSLVPTGAEKLKALDPSSWRPKSVADSDLALALQLSKIPAQIKDQFIQAFEAQAAQQEARRPGESDSEFKGRTAANEMAKDAVKALIRDGDTLSLGLSLDRVGRGVSVELAASAMPNTAMAGAFRGFGERRSAFSFLGAGSAAATGWIKFLQPAGLREALRESIEAEYKKHQANLKTDEEKAKDTRAFEKLKKLLDAEEVDWGLTIRTPQAGPDAGKLLLLSGMKLKGVDAEKFFRELLAEAPLPKGAKLEYDVARAADGTGIHRLIMPKDQAASDDLNLFGDPTLYLAFPGGTVVLAFGQGGVDALKSTIADLKKGPAGSGTPAAVELHLASLGRLAQPQDAEAVRAATEETFKGPDAGRDAVRLVLDGDDRSIRLRLGVDYAAFSFLAKLGTVTQAGGKVPLQIRVPAPN